MDRRHLFCCCWLMDRRHLFCCCCCCWFGGGLIVGTDRWLGGAMFIFLRKVSFFCLLFFSCIFSNIQPVPFSFYRWQQRHHIARWGKLQDAITIATMAQILQWEDFGGEFAHPVILPLFLFNNIASLTTPPSNIFITRSPCS